MNFSQRLWQQNLPIYQAILTMPFIKEMANGSLPLAKFQQYIIQDAHYLISYGKALAIAAAKADNKDDFALFSLCAYDSVIVERSLHENYMQQYSISAEDFAISSPTPSCALYSNFLLSCVWSSAYPVAIAALLPCFWIYAEVGREIASQSIKADNPYMSWIQTYADEDFWQTTTKAIAALDLVASNASALEQLQMEKVFAQSCRLEWMFWDAAYRQETWPI